MVDETSSIRQVTCSKCNGVGQVTLPVTIEDIVDGETQLAETWVPQICDACGGSGTVPGEESN